MYYKKENYYLCTQMNKEMTNLYPLRPASWRPEDEYGPLCMDFEPCYTYLEGDERERRWVDYQNMCYCFLGKEKDGLIDGKKFWSISPEKPNGATLTEDNLHLIKWFVEWSSEDSDIGYEWDFEKHEPIRVLLLKDSVYEERRI